MNAYDVAVIGGGAAGLSGAVPARPRRAAIDAAPPRSTPVGVRPAPRAQVITAAGEGFAAIALNADLVNEDGSRVVSYRPHNTPTKVRSE